MLPSSIFLLLPLAASRKNSLPENVLLLALFAPLLSVSSPRLPASEHSQKSDVTVEPKPRLAVSQLFP